jgi:hypothetical protein
MGLFSFKGGPIAIDERGIKPPIATSARWWPRACPRAASPSTIPKRSPNWFERDRVFSFEEAKNAYHYQLSHDLFGKVVVEFMWTWSFARRGRKLICENASAGSSRQGAAPASGGAQWRRAVTEASGMEARRGRHPRRRSSMRSTRARPAAQRRETPKRSSCLQLM